MFGDPLYAPFRSQQAMDKTHPVLGPVTLTAGEDGIIASAALAGLSADELAEVALFRLDYGPTTAYGQAVDFFDWPEPQKSNLLPATRASDAEPTPAESQTQSAEAGETRATEAGQGRRFGYSRFFQATLKDLPKGEPVHFRLTARDPFGHEASTEDAVFVP